MKWIILGDLKFKDHLKASLNVSTWPWIYIYDYWDRLVATAKGGYVASWQGIPQPAYLNRPIEFKYGLNSLSGGWSNTTNQDGKGQASGDYTFFVQPRYGNDDFKEGQVVSRPVNIGREDRKSPGCDNPDDNQLTPGLVLDQGIEVGMS